MDCEPKPSSSNETLTEPELENSIESLKINEQLKELLKEKGFKISEILKSKPSNLKSDLGITAKDALLIINAAKDAEPTSSEKFSVASRNALDMIYDAPNASILTFSKALDDLLDGGISTNCLTEIVGESGCAKTQFCLQIAAAATIPQEMGGLNASTIYIDTHNGVFIDRVKSITLGVVEKCHKSARENQLDISKELESYTLEMALSKILIQKPISLQQLMISIGRLEEFIKLHSQVRVIIIDSITFPIKYVVHDSEERLKILLSIHATLRELSQDYNLAVLWTNQMTTGPNRDSVAALGDSWAHACTQRLTFSKLNDDFQANIWKSSSNQGNSIVFKEEGIRDAEET
ncbi:DgyrCDS6834 [Dimorphilus gyrociliatus]|uniref:DNA repair protein RAD51 homolog 3 n=1 Tax=Dimorphilus gyrociliatus TaxID=2664684 RepID=A0A7I8VRH2_9ANNE|nr:DgyrCDS6834 [Dimorphilus gyrociliatus]